MSADVPSVLGADINFVNRKTCREGVWAPVNASHPSLLWNAASSYSVSYSRKATIYQKEAEQRPLYSGEEVRIFLSHLPPSGQAVPLSQGKTGGKIELKIK